MTKLNVLNASFLLVLLKMTLKKFVSHLLTVPPGLYRHMTLTPSRLTGAIGKSFGQFKTKAAVARAGPSRISLILNPLTQLKLEIFTNCQNSTLSHVIKATAVVRAARWMSPRSTWPIMAV